MQALVIGVDGVTCFDYLVHFIKNYNELGFRNYPSDYIAGMILMAHNLGQLNILQADDLFVLLYDRHQTLDV
jgi:hypothetical protein